ncbi:serine/threonine protein kinase [Nocardioides panacisoli]|uniref:serine/threonine protein kinase n=1 Tax=Nocardioides panacisoli TaxID=627624 RepID=UPI001C63467E|nr:serine/threonine protein kinase [Nocardioides panacisoli]QYJ04351.1 serine/threonine protein kinase [Nocardioides panacisoli]
MPRSTPRRLAVSALALAAAVAGAAGLPGAAPATADPADAAKPVGKQREVMWVGNNWAGTASVVDVDSLEILRSGVDLIPDKAEELARIRTSPIDLAFYLAIQAGPGEGHDQYVDDMFTTNDGRYLAVSRPSFADVVWIDIEKATNGEPDSIVREQQMDGFRTDHMAVSPDGRRLLVSDSTSRQVIEYAMGDETLPDGTEVVMGDRLRTFESGETPHESNYTVDGERIFHASIGRVYTPLDGTGNSFLDMLLKPVIDAAKADRWFQVVRNDDFEIEQRWDMAHELAEAGHPNMSSAVRPMAVAPGGRFLYYQVSFFHGLVEFDTQAPDTNGTTDYALGDQEEPPTGAVTRVIELEDRVPTMPRELYVNDSAHHGLSIDESGETLCVAGTMDDYAALVDVSTGEATYYDEQTTGHTYLKPYWTTEGPHDTCWISLSESDAVAVLDTRTGEELAYLPVGDHPQRVRLGTVPERVVRAW